MLYIKTILLNNQDTNILLFAASTKRLFKKEKESLKLTYKNVLFTIGDNGTSVLLLENIKQEIEQNKISTKDNIIIVGVTGILGEAVSKYFYQSNYDNVYIMSSSLTGSKNIQIKYPTLKVIENFYDIKNVKMVITCTHNDYSLLKSSDITNFKPKNQKLIIVDVAEPANVKNDVLAESKEDIIYKKEGDGYSKDIKYSKDYDFTNNVAFGCVSEALVLGLSNKYKEQDWFEITEMNQKIILELFKEFNIIPA